MDQGVRYVVSINGQMQVISSLNSMESAAVKTDASVANLNNTLRNLGAGLGLGMGLHALVDFGKDAVQGAADFETAVKRIKFASENLTEGAKNISFIADEAEKFKIPLQSATDSYGKFLAMLAGSDIASDRVRSLHDDLLLIGKVKGLGDGQLDAAVMNLGKMLESGSLDARHFRPLEQQLSGIGAFVARELGITVHQLAVLRNKGKMTQIDPHVLLSAIHKQRESLEQFLPESTETLQSNLNELDNAWLKFKNDLVFDNRAELKALFETLKDGIKFLHDNRGEIIATGKVVLTLGEAWLKIKLVMGAVNIATTTYRSFMAGYAGEAAAEITATEAKTIAYNSLAAAVERLNLATSFGGAYGMGKYGTPLLAAGGGNALAAEEGVAATEAGALAGVSIVSGALLVSLAAGSIAALAIAMSDKGKAGAKVYGSSGFYDGTPVNGLKGRFVNDSTYGLTPAGDTVFNKRWQPDTVDMSTFGKLNQQTQNYLNAHAPATTDKANKAKGDAGRIIPPNDKVTGQRVITYNIRIGEINGIKENKVSEGGTLNTQRVAEELRDIINSIVNDSQIKDGN